MFAEKYKCLDDWEHEKAKYVVTGSIKGQLTRTSISADAKEHTESLRSTKGKINFYAPQEPTCYVLLGTG